MPDRRRHRGPHPQDRALFAEPALPVLRQAVADLSWLVGRGYSEDASLELVGNRFQLKERQRVAVRRSACSDAAQARRLDRRLGLDACRGRPIAVDGFNLLITVESALAGAVVLRGRDRCCRDLASVWGTYRRIDETGPALDLILGTLRQAGIGEVDWLLDRPVSNSGRLKGLIAERLPPGNRWRIELCADPDRELIVSTRPVVSSDARVLDGCSCSLDLASEIILGCLPDAWVVDLSEPGSAEARPA
jgi:hypothetical protein